MRDDAGCLRKTSILSQTRADSDRELEYTLPPLIRRGGYVIAMGYRIPNGSLLGNYRSYVQGV